MDPTSTDPTALLSGVLHVFVAFDWGDEIDLAKARSLVPASTHELPRRRRTPPSFSYRPAPLYVPLAPLRLELDGLPACHVPAGLTVFDFAAVSLNLRMPFRLPPEQVLRLAGALAEPAGLVAKARAALTATFETLRPAILFEIVWAFVRRCRMAPHPAMQRHSGASASAYFRASTEVAAPPRTWCPGIPS